MDNIYKVKFMGFPGGQGVAIVQALSPEEAEQLVRRKILADHPMDADCLMRGGFDAELVWSMPHDTSGIIYFDNGDT